MSTAFALLARGGWRIRAASSGRSRPARRGSTFAAPLLFGAAKAATAARGRRLLNTVPTCPEPTCDCAETPAMPFGSGIDRSANLNGLMPAYAQQVLICTGRDDWASRIEEDHSGDNLAADLKELIGRGGMYSDPFHNISVLNASFPSAVSRRPEVQTTSAYLLPSFTYVPFLPRVSFDSVQALVKGYLLPERLHPMHDGLSPIHRDRLRRSDAYRALLYGVRDAPDVLVLVCGHGTRDRRCGIYGPLLQAEFERQLPRAGIRVLHGPAVDESVPAAAVVVAPQQLPGGSSDGVAQGEAAPPPADGPAAVAAAEQTTARVGQISHIGGHKYAGNVIIYLPPRLRGSDGGPHPLAGHGIWYGRIDPKHVEGVIAETIVNGNVIAEHFRGGINQQGEILRL
ncbi:Sucrase/ferredoxin-like-domain-containing protein [Durotheca rogersii]|uniref:Sucrase/ferredoxin-like-domain-containing protein n=1 Tax=Durotheca rogersii TaxID=419775 RepID=UPI00221EDFA5|nr:Sucrase/ferredoxin-like-domain-containing protein [Durotheca rogersii]KAI5867272.1 Sucrase/ferredoxin-like-domain-containing protein [Durotheca rogersii]